MLLYNRVTLDSFLQFEKDHNNIKISDVDCGDKTWDYGEDYKPIPTKIERGDLESSE